MPVAKRTGRKLKGEKELRKIIGKQSVENYIDLVGWLYKNHLKVLREYEATKGRFRIHFASSRKGGKD